jgi:hypothetical protein
MGVAGKEVVASMRRKLSLMAVAAIMLALIAGPVLAQGNENIPPPGENIPGKAEENAPQTNPDNFPETEQVGENCYGAAVRDFLAGPGKENPGSAADPTTFEGRPAFNGPVTSGFAQQQQVDEFQRASRDAFASCPEPEGT